MNNIILTPTTTCLIRALMVENKGLEYTMIGKAVYSENEFHVTNLIPTFCENSSCTTTIDIIKSDYDLDILDFQENEIFVWFHSHNEMGVTFSGQDYKQMEIFSSLADSKTLSIVGNSEGEFSATFYYHDKTFGPLVKAELTVIENFIVNDYVSDQLNDSRKKFINDFSLSKNKNKNKNKPKNIHTPSIQEYYDNEYSNSEKWWLQ